MKKRYVITIAILVLAVLVNIGLAIVFPGDNGANIFTAISGWISGIATIVLGVIALVVNAKYKEDNDEYAKKQSDLFWREEKRTTIELYRDQIIRCYNSFLSYNYADILSELVSNEEKIEAPLKELAILSKIQTAKHDMFFTLGICRYYFTFKAELFDAYGLYLAKLNELVTDYKNILYGEQFDKGEELQELYVTVLNNFNIHISSINAFLSSTLYVKNREELVDKFKEMRDKQAEWWNNNKPKESK